MTNGDDDQHLPLAWEKGKVIAQFLGVIANVAIAWFIFGSSRFCVEARRIGIIFWKDSLQSLA
jgi:hypothetical protein